MVVNSRRKSIGKIIDTCNKDKVLECTRFKPKVLLYNRVALLNIHDMDTMYETGQLSDQRNYKPRFIVVDVNDSDILPVIL